MTERKRKSLFWAFKIASVLVSCAFPIWAICERFPIWTVDHGTKRTVSLGLILILFVVLVIFRKSVFDFVKKHLKLENAPPLTIWLVLIVICNLLIYLGEVMKDMTIVFWMGLIGCVIGNLLTFIAERFSKDVSK